MNSYRLVAGGLALITAARAALIATSPKRLTYLDIGARGGLPRRWKLLQKLGRIEPVFVEADQEAANALSGRVVRAALGSQSGLTTELRITRGKHLSSVLEPIPERWPSELVSSVEVVERIPVALSRLDEVWPKDLRAPHFIKVDVQGYDLEVLKGFGDLLHEVHCAEVEVRIAQQYVDQPPPSEVYSFMKENGFDMVGFKANSLQAGTETVVFNAFFARANLHTHPSVRLWKVMNWIGGARRVSAFGI